MSSEIIFSLCKFIFLDFSVGRYVIVFVITGEFKYGMIKRVKFG